MSETSDIAGVPTRRTLVAGVGVAGLAAALTACGGSEDSSSSTSGAATPAQGGASSPDSSPDSGSGEASGLTVAANKVPSGGGTVFEGEKVVVTQPTAGQYKAFSAVCPHQGCIVKEVTDGTIVCPCHQSKFSITDGSRQSGPATKGLTAIKTTVEGSEIKLG